MKMQIRCAWVLLFAVGTLPASSQSNNRTPMAAADYAALAQQAAQRALSTRRSDDFISARSNILEAVTLDPTNEDYLVAATTYIDGETRFTPQKQLDGCKYAERAIQLSHGENAEAFFHAAEALDFVGYPAREYLYAQQALKRGGLSAVEEAAAQKMVKDLSPRKTILWNILDKQEILREPSGLAAGNGFFYYPVPPSLFINQTDEYSVYGALKWDKVESNGDTFLRIWPGAYETIEIRIVVSRFKDGHKVIFEDHSQPLPLNIAAFTNSTRFIDAAAPEVQMIAKTLRRTNWVETAKAIVKYVNGEIKDEDAGTSQKSSTAVLQTKTGMCMDQANLCVALARANGIPARMVHGSESFNEGGKFTGLTAGHFWAEVYIPGTGWCEFVSDADCFGWIPWFCIRWYWQDTEVLHRKKWDTTSPGLLDLPIAPPLINEEMERTKYILWLGMSDRSINQIGTRWHMIKDW
jgi:transglutaminase-like putative cysteine protease